MKRVLLVGPPGSGKGTQAEKICKYLNIPHISTGGMLRDAVASGSDLGKKIEGILAKGELVSDELITSIVGERLGRDDCKNGFLLDGFPRTKAQAQALDRILVDKPLTHIIELVVPHEDIVKRLLDRAKVQARSDDTIDVIENRIKVYEAQTKTVVEHYSGSRFFKIDGSKTIDEVSHDVRKVLEHLS